MKTTFFLIISAVSACWRSPFHPKQHASWDDCWKTHNCSEKITHGIAQMSGFDLDYSTCISFCCCQTSDKPGTCPPAQYLQELWGVHIGMHGLPKMPMTKDQVRKMIITIATEWPPEDQIDRLRSKGLKIIADSGFVWPNDDPYTPAALDEASRRNAEKLFQGKIHPGTSTGTSQSRSTGHSHSSSHHSRRRKHK